MSGYRIDTQLRMLRSLVRRTNNSKDMVPREKTRRRLNMPCRIDVAVNERTYELSLYVDGFIICISIEIV